MSSDPEASAVYAVLRVKDAAGEVDIQVGDRRYLAVLLYKPKAVALRDRLYLRLLASDGVDSSGFTKLGIDIAGVVVATDSRGQGPRPLLRSARLTMRVTTVQRGGVDVAPAALVEGTIDERTPPIPRTHVPHLVSTRLALPSFEEDTASAKPPRTPPAGKLAARTMADLVGHLVREGGAASIEVTHEHGLGGSIFVEGGVVVAAWAGSTRGTAAVMQLARYVGAAFRVRPGCTTVMRNVDEPSAVVLAELARVKAPASFPRGGGAVFADEPTLQDFDPTSLSSHP